MYNYAEHVFIPSRNLFDLIRTHHIYNVKRRKKNKPKKQMVLNQNSYKV